MCKKRWKRCEYEYTKSKISGDRANKRERESFPTMANQERITYMRVREKVYDVIVTNIIDNYKIMCMPRGVLEWEVYKANCSGERIQTLAYNVYVEWPKCVYFQSVYLCDDI